MWSATGGGSRCSAEFNTQGEIVALPERIEALLRASDRALSRAALRSQLRVNNHRLGDALAALESDGRARRSTEGWSLERPAPTPSLAPAAPPPTA